MPALLRRSQEQKGQPPPSSSVPIDQSPPPEEEKKPLEGEVPNFEDYRPTPEELAGSAPKGPADRSKMLTEALQQGDESSVMQVVIELSSELSMAQETTISPQTLDQLVAPLVQCLGTQHSPDSTRNPKPANPLSLRHNLSHPDARHQAYPLQPSCWSRRRHSPLQEIGKRRVHRVG